MKSIPTEGDWKKLQSMGDRFWNTSLIIEEPKHRSADSDEEIDVVNVSPEDGKNKKPTKPKCTKCENHGQVSNVAGHKAKCPFRDCVCKMCFLVSQRRSLMSEHSQLMRQDPPTSQQRKEEAEDKKRNPCCARCKNHGVVSPVAKHKKWCTFKYCPCPKCKNTKWRQQNMATQIRIKRHRKQDLENGKPPEISKRVVLDHEKAPIAIDGPQSTEATKGVILLFNGVSSTRISKGIKRQHSFDEDDSYLISEPRAKTCRT